MKAVEAAIRGATVLTPTDRLSRELNRQFGQAQRQRGNVAWATPSILPFDAFLQRLWREWLFTSSDEAAPVLLSPLQERRVFQQALAECEQDRPLQLAATGRAALKAWQLAHAWRVALSDSRFATTEDSEAFVRWASAFDRHCRRENWLDSARLPDFLIDRIHDGSLKPPSRVALAGFDELTPQQESFLAAIPRVDQTQGPAHSSVPARIELRDASEEFEQAAGWARVLLSRNPRARIGIVVPNLADCRAQVDRLFREVLHPGPFPTGPRAYHVSLGLALANYAIVAAALLALETGLPRMRADRVGMLLRSPFVGAASGDGDARAQADLKLRRDHRFEVSREKLRTTHSLFAARPEEPPEKQRPGEWAFTFSRLLAALGWPGDRPLSSDEHQTIEAWNNALSSFATLDLTQPALRYEEALDELRGLTVDTIFQAEDEGAPVQIMGVEEAAGLEFDALWVTGVHDEQFPRQPRPNAFLPLTLQREHNLPHATPRREVESAQAVLGRLLASAPDVILSYPTTDGEKILKASPLLATLNAEAMLPNLADSTLRRWHRLAPLESLQDETAPPLSADGVQVGGAGLLKAMAECPFKAFAIYRLNAGPLEDAEFGLSPSEKGKTVHRALELIWTELRSQADLLGLSEEDARELIRRHVAAALIDDSSPFRHLEQRRLEILIQEFLQLERLRRPFTVNRREDKQTVQVGGLTLSIRVDREDELDDGSLVLIDYKTGKIKTNGWVGERLREPQLPLYATAREGKLAGVSLAAIRTGEVGFTAAQEVAALGKAKTMKMDLATLAEERARWATALDRLAIEFRDGVARVDPLPHACDFCELKALCRIRDYSEPEAPDADE